MASIINRTYELSIIDEAFNALLDQTSLLRTPIIDVHGIEGIGKTTILQHVAQKCKEYHLPYLWVDASGGIPAIAHEIIEQIKQHHPSLITHLNIENPLDQVVSAIQLLLEQNAVVLVLDAIDTENEELLRWIELMLRDLLENNRLFVVIASRKSLQFEHERSVARKLTPLQLNPFDRASSEQYLDTIDIEPETHHYIFKWTRGYPLAMDTMARAMSAGQFDLEKSQDRKRLIKIITERVIDRGILAKIDPSEYQWYRAILSLLSVPRRFNLVIMQMLIRQYASQFAPQNSLAYIGLPKRINRTTDILNWNMPRAGFSIDAPIRNIFLLQLQIEEPEAYFAIHSTLARINQQLAEAVTGTDRVRYLQEYLYHSAHTSTGETLQQLLEQTVQQIINESPEAFSQFSEEYSQDEELKEALGAQAATVTALIHAHQLTTARLLVKESTGRDRVRNLHEYLNLLLQDPVATTIPANFQQAIREIKLTEQADIRRQLYSELAQDSRLKEILGEHIESISSLVRDDS
ncbi:MAG TPA: NB-ARC domain-containing protein [Ktedonobacteraceae bacterium]|nr:NB-ARC domain-containing protein [Ktedonobacteraceae bacterium]